jgi:hypothetical protein
LHTFFIFVTRMPLSKLVSRTYTTNIEIIEATSVTESPAMEINTPSRAHRLKLVPV